MSRSVTPARTNRAPGTPTRGASGAPEDSIITDSFEEETGLVEGDYRMIDRRYDPKFCELLAGSYRRLLGFPLVSPEMSLAEAARWLYDEAPFAVLAHNAAPDPIFVYGNRAAQRCFEYSWEELLVLPSRLSAEPVDRGERQRFMERAAWDGHATGYRGVRIAKSGRRFVIENATIWNWVDSTGACCGQAAMFAVPKLRDGAS